MRTVPAAPAALLILAGVATQAWLALRLNVNWDEFRFLDLVHTHARGDLDRPLQTFHVHFFAWLGAVPGGEIGQITAGRLVMLACQAATLALIWATGRHVAGPAGATLAALGWLAAEHTVQHGASFRADPLGAALLMLALYIVAVRRLSAVAILVAAAAGALAMLVTVKAALYAPAFLGAALLRLIDPGQRADVAVRLAAMAGLAAVLAAALLALHAGQLGAPEPRSAPADAGSVLDTAFRSGTFPRAEEVAHWAPRSLVPLALITMGLAAAPRRGRGPAVAMALFAAPLLSILVYRNAYPYFFPFILAPAMVVAALGGAALARRPAAMAAVLAAAAASLTAQTMLALPRDQAAQRAVIAAVHAAFPEPVAYVDRAGMIALFPREGFFMSSWGLAKYHAAGRPVFPDIIDRAAPPLVIANVDTLRAALGGGQVRPDRALLPEDAALLRATYIAHWGPIWVAGRRLTLGAGERRDVEIRIPGPYTIEAAAPVMLDGRRQLSGTTVTLRRGTSTVEATEPGVVVLRYGRSLPRPSAAPPGEPVFWRF